MKMRVLFAMLLSLMFFGCSSEDIPQAHKGQMFDRTGAFAMWAGGDGFNGPVLEPGTVYTGLYDTVRLLECSEKTIKEKMPSLTKDGVQFALDVYVRYSANCGDQEAVLKALHTLTPIDEKGQPTKAITPEQLYRTFLRPAIGEAVRQAISPYIANDINMNRDKIFEAIKKSFAEKMKSHKPPLVTVAELNLSNLDLPQTLVDANTARAKVAIDKDRAIAEREKVKAEIETAEARTRLAEIESHNDAVKIDGIGEALKRNPAYLQYQLQQLMPSIYQKAGEKGNMVITAPNPSVLVSPKPGK